MATPSLFSRVRHRHNKRVGKVIHVSGTGKITVECDDGSHLMDYALAFEPVREG